VHALKLPLAADWSPEPEFCAANKSGWRHVSVLKTQLLVLVLSAGYDCFVADADWQVMTCAHMGAEGCSLAGLLARTWPALLVANSVTPPSAEPLCWQLSNVTLDVLMQLRASSWDIVGTNDYDGMNNGAGMLNVGMMWVRHTPDTELLAQAVANRSYAAWDQAVFNEEVDAASSVRCCCSAGLLHTAFEHVAANGKTTNEGKYAPSAQESCQATRCVLWDRPFFAALHLPFDPAWARVAQATARRQPAAELDFAHVSKHLATERVQPGQYAKARKWMRKDSLRGAAIRAGAFNAATRAGRRPRLPRLTGNGSSAV
jgi:hypothetical protein